MKLIRVGCLRVAAVWLSVAMFNGGAGLSAAWVAAPPGLVGWWPGEGSAQDIAGTNHGILRGGSTADVDAMVGTGFSFDGTNKYVEIPNAPQLNPQELSVECWVRFDNLDAPGTSVYIGQQYLVFKQNTRSADFEGYVLSKDRTHADIILWEVTSSRGKLVRIDSVSAVTTNVWYHLVGTRGADYIKLYFNGKLEAQAAVDFPQDYGNHPLYFGTSGQAYYDRRLNGVLDEVSLYNRALTAAEVAALYAAGSAGKGRLAKVTVNGKGWVSPNYNGRGLRNGVPYRMTAYAGKGYVFSNWTGSVVSTSRTIVFPGQSGVVLQANFVPNPFVESAGTYRGLFFEESGARHETSGSVILQVTTGGTFSGKLDWGGARHSFSGKFDLEGSASVSISGAQGTEMTLGLRLDLSGGDLTGTVSGNGWVASLETERDVYDANTNRCPYAGRYTLAMAPEGAAGVVPEGSGIAVVKVRQNGMITWNGYLADGVAVGGSSAVGDSGQWPFYRALYGGDGSVFGWLQFEDSAAVDIRGNLIWSRPGIDGARYYPAGFVMEVGGVGSRYVRPDPGERVLGFGPGWLELTGGNLPEPISEYVELGPGNQVASTNGVALRFNLVSGTFHGSCAGTGGGARHAFRGVVLQKANVGAGYFRDTDRCGRVVIGGWE